MKNTAIFEMLLFIVLPYLVFKMQQPTQKEVAKRKAVTAACTEELQAALGREPEQGEISRAVADRYQAEYDAYWAAKTARKAERKAAKAERKAERKAAKADAKVNQEILSNSRAMRREWNKIFRQLGVRDHY